MASASATCGLDVDDLDLDVLERLAIDEPG